MSRKTGQSPKNTAHRYVEGYRKARRHGPEHSSGSAGDCISLLTGEVFSPRRKPKRYDVYILSKAWRDLRARYIASDRPRSCYVCDAPYAPTFQMHHLTYERFGGELLTDVCLCCVACHGDIHRAHRSRPAIGIAAISRLMRDAYRAKRSIQVEELPGRKPWRENATIVELERRDKASRKALRPDPPAAQPPVAKPVKAEAVPAPTPTDPVWRAKRKRKKLIARLPLDEILRRTPLNFVYEPLRDRKPVHEMIADLRRRTD